MEAICINVTKVKPCGECGNYKHGLKENNNYNVSQCSESNDAFDVEGLERCGGCGKLQSFDKKRFVPLSNIDEMELLEQRENNLVNI